MPSIFSRRRAPSNPPVDRATQASAAAAANQAYVQRHSSMNSLSNAAAAAALRSLTTTPEPIGNIQTKRMVRRGSVSSVGSGSVVGTGTRRFSLQRQNSNTGERTLSMTERTFRSPSPGGRSNGRASPAFAAFDAPPVPAIPKKVPSGHKRSSSVDPPPRVTSPTPPKGKRSESARPPPPINTRMKRLSNVSEIDELDRQQESPNAVNFSRPRPSPQSSPVTERRQGGYYTKAQGTGPAARARPMSQPVMSNLKAAQDASNVQSSIQGAAAKTNVKRSQITQPAAGSHLAKANAGYTKPAASDEETETIMVFDANSRSFVPKQISKKPAQPESPVLPKAAPLVPGTYDPSTRTIVPGAEPVKRSQSPGDLTPRSAKMLQKQPSVVREDPEGEDKAARLNPASGRTIQTSAGPAKTYTGPGSRTVSLSPARGRGNGRVQSLSPHRAHFSSAPMIDTKMHVPPGRDVSPAKSAMKASPASSIRTSSPMAHFSSSTGKTQASDASDTTSVASQEGAKKKKSVRVSFDEHAPAVVAPVVVTPAAKPAGRVISPIVNDDMEEIMQPRPDLPTFGSVRNSRSPEVAEKVTEMPPERHEVSNDHAVGGILSDDLAEKQKSAEAPVPPEVTSKENTASISDASDDVFEPKASAPAEMATDSTETKARDFATEGKSETEGPTEEDANLPAINLLPPTPGKEEEKQLGDRVSEDGNRPASVDDFQVPQEFSQDIENGTKPAFVLPPVIATSNLDEDDDDHEPAEPQSPTTILDAINEDSDDSAAFSDAAEDQSEFDDGGYASLNAIAVSPVAAKNVSKAPTSDPMGPLPDSPTVSVAAKRMSRQEGSGGSGDWKEATAYWSQLSRQQRQQIEQAHGPTEEEKAAAAAQAAKAKTPKKSAMKQPAAVSPTAVSPPAAAATPPADKPKSAMKKTMRAQPGPQPAPAAESGDVQLRKTMRGPGNGRMMTSMRDGPPKPRPQSAIVDPSPSLPSPNMRRPMSASGHPLPPPSPPTKTSQGSSFPFFSGKKEQGPPPSINNTSGGKKLSKGPEKVNDDSDSESSFKRKRRSSVSSSTGKYNMKRSMRAASVDVPERRPMSPGAPPSKGSGAFSLRAKSPTGSMFSRKDPEKLRQSLRSSSVDGRRTTLRNGPVRPAAPTPAPARRSKFKSRFADSDDEDDGPSFFQSRFNDSDDSDNELTPVRGIPRKQGQRDGDSTELDDSDDEKNVFRKRSKGSKGITTDPADVEKAMAAARLKLGIPAIDPNAANQGSALQKGSLRNNSALQPESPAPDSGKKKRSFMGSILRRNRNSSTSVPTASQTASPAQPAPEVPQTPTSPQAAAPPPAPATPTSPLVNKLFRRNSQQTQTPPYSRLKRGDSNYSNMTAPPEAGRRDYDDWPIPPIPGTLAANAGMRSSMTVDRPMTSDGASDAGVRMPRTLRQPGSVSNFGKGVRILGPQDDAISVPGDDVPASPKGTYSSKTGKKKKFGLLRKAFKLDD